MNTGEMVKAVSEKSGLSQKDVRAVLEGLGVVVRRELKARGEVPLPEIGKLKAHLKPERRGISPATKEPYVSKAHHVARLVPAKSLADAVA